MEVPIKNKEANLGRIKILQDGEIFTLALGELKFSLPYHMGRNLLTATKLQNHFQKIYTAVGDDWDKDNKSFRYRAQHAYDCHQFVLRCLGFNLSLKEIKDKSLETLIPFFGKGEYKKLNSITEILLEIKDIFKDSKILVGQIASKNQKGALILNHTFFVLKLDNEYAVLQKEGFGGVVSLYELSSFFGDYYFNHPSNYGDYFAFAAYEDIREKFFM